MTRPSPYTSYLGNYNGDSPTIPLRAVLVPQEPLGEVDPTRPTLVAYRGYDYRHQGMFLRPFYYFDGAIWRDTLTDEAWRSVHTRSEAA
jgi:hypothetical protein